MAPQKNPDNNSPNSTKKPPGKRMRIVVWAFWILLVVVVAGVGGAVFLDVLGHETAAGALLGYTTAIAVLCVVLILAAIMAKIFGFSIDADRIGRITVLGDKASKDEKLSKMREQYKPSASFERADDGDEGSGGTRGADIDGDDQKEPRRSEA